jgi:hypothetical protein
MACRELQPLIKKSLSFQGVSRLLAALIAMRFTSESLSIRFGQQGWGLSAIHTLVRPRLSGVSCNLTLLRLLPVQQVEALAVV